MNYRIEKNGDIFNKKGLKLKTYISKFGYERVTLSHNGSKKAFFVHRLVAQEYLQNIKNKPCVNHKDGNKLNNNVNNLEWCTYSENSKHAFENGLNKGSYGEIHGLTKLTNKDVIYIYINPDKKTNKQLANIFNVDSNMISRIWNNHTWKHITKDLTPRWRSLKNGKGFYEYRLP